MQISVILPCYNNEKIISDSIIKVEEELSLYFAPNDYEIIVVNDGSKDKSAAVIQETAAKYCQNVRFISYEKNRGKGYAVRQGMLEAQGDFVIFTDADLAYGTKKISKFFYTWQKKDCDVMIGSRNISRDGYAGYTWSRKVMSKVYIRILRVMTGLKQTDFQCGIKGFSSEAAKEIFSECEADRFEFDMEVLMIAKRKGLVVKEMPVTVINHQTSTVSPAKDSIKMFKQVFVIKKREKKRRKVCAAA